MADENPILNNPYEEPQWHYATNLQGELDYSHPVKGRRVFTPENRESTCESRREETHRRTTAPPGNTSGCSETIL